jgi:DNA end-binding protein Ku
LAGSLAPIARQLRGRPPQGTTVAGDISFSLINPETGNRIKMITTDPDTGPVDRSTLVKGYAVEKNNYVLFSDEDFDSVKLETTKTLEIERFVDADTIDRLYWDTPYVLVPQDEGSAQAYAVIQQAMVQANRIALGRVVMHTRERLMAIEPRGAGLLATTLRTRDEVVNVADALEDVPQGKPDKQMIVIAQRIIEQKDGEFDPDQFTDRYEDASRALIEEKKRGHKITRVEESEDTTNVVDLMAALKKSLTAGSSTPKKAVLQQLSAKYRKQNRAAEPRARPRWPAPGDLTKDQLAALLYVKAGVLVCEWTYRKLEKVHLAL